MDIRFAFPIRHLPFWLLLAAAGLMALYFVLRRLERRREGRLHQFAEAALAPRLLVGYDARVRRPLTWFTLAGCAFLMLAMMQPRWGRDRVEVQRGSRDILVLLDTSESMNAEDPLPSRMQRARQKVETLMELCPGDRFGLVAFSGDAALQCPLTLDQGYVRSVVNVVNTDTLSAEGTNIEAALETAAEVFEEAGATEEDRYSRAIVLISDGEEVSGSALDMAARMGDYAGIYVIGIGDPEGAAVAFPDWMRQYVRRQPEELTHVTRLNEEMLSELARNAGGAYVRTTPDNRDVQYIVNELEALQARAVSGEVRFNMVNRYRWPLAAALACFAAEGLWLVLMPVIRRWRMRRLAHGGEEAYYA